MEAKANWVEPDATGKDVAKSGFRWLGFDWITVVYRPNESPPVIADLGLLKTCTISVVVKGQFQEPPTYDWQGPGLQNFERESGQNWTASGSFQGSTFNATWNRQANTLPGEPDQSVGQLSVTLDPQTYRVVSFSAKKTETSPPGTDPHSETTVSINGRNIPLAGYLGPPQFTPYLLCYLEGEETCQHLSSYEYRTERAESEWFTVAPWTDMVAFTCAGLDTTPAVAISFKDK